ncbi:hypothetical protein BKA63DRAFT_489223 [Paraphoma chrysanthemicola]|nr:hypothetical protein BKA63DRAFT_489223 [Paraphoma chrysanthemicola]
MNLGYYEGVSYVPPGGTRAEKRRRQEQWDSHQREQQAHRCSMEDVPKEERYHNSTPSRKRTDSSPTPSPQSIDASPSSTSSTQCRSSSDYDPPRRYSSADHRYAGNRLSPQLSPLHPQGELRRLSGNFNAPTHVELERERENRKSLKGIEKLRNKLRGLARG